MDRLSELEAFVNVAETKSFTAAGKALGVSASAVSKQIQSLEERLGVRLFHRTTRRVSLTEVARSYLEPTREALQDLAEAEAALTQLQAEPRGRLRVNAPLDFGRMHLTAAFAEFAARHPALDLELVLSNRFVDLVEEGFDVVVRIGRMPESSLVARRLAPCRRVLCASPAYLDEHGRPQSAGDLLHHRRIAYQFESDRGWKFRGRRRRVLVPTRHESNDGELVRALTAAGLGIALLPTFIASDDLRSGRLETVLADSLDEDTAMFAVYPHRKQLPEKVRRFVDFLAEHCGARPYWDEGLELA